MYNNNQEYDHIFPINETILDSEFPNQIFDNSFYEKQFLDNFNKNKDNIIDEKITLTIENKPKFIFNLEKSDNYKYHYSKKKKLLLTKDEKIKRKLKNNAESAKKARDRKKLFYDNILKENLKLKKEIEEIKKKNLIFINKLCDKCKKEWYNQSLCYLPEKNNMSNHIKMLLFSSLTISIITFCMLYNIK